MRIFFIRHGRQESMLCNVDVALAPEGREQAALAGERMRDYGIEMLFTSDMIRAVQTGEIINEVLKVPSMVIPGFREIEFGDMEGLTDEELHTKYADYFAERDKFEKDLHLPNGENGQECCDRMLESLHKAIEVAREKKVNTIAVVSHGGAIRCMLAGMLGMNMARRLQFVKNMENCGITEMEYDEKRDRFYIERINDYAHLEGHDSLLRKHFKKSLL